MKKVLTLIERIIDKYNRWMDAEVERVLEARNPSQM